MFQSTWKVTRVPPRPWRPQRSRQVGLDLSCGASSERTRLVWGEGQRFNLPFRSLHTREWASSNDALRWINREKRCRWLQSKMSEKWRGSAAAIKAKINSSGVKMAVHATSPNLELNQFAATPLSDRWRPADCDCVVFILLSWAHTQVQTQLPDHSKLLLI